MDINLTTVFQFLAEPPGDLIYHLVVSLPLMLLLIFSVVSRESSQNGNQTSSSVLGYSVILVLQLLLYFLRPVIPNFLPDGNYFYPLFERVTATLIIIWVMYIFYSDHEYKILISLTFFFSLALIVLAGATILLMPVILQLQNINFFIVDLLWQLTALILIVIGLGLVIFNPPPQRWILVIIFLFLAGGHFLQIFLSDNLQWNMGAIRFAQTLSLPWLLGTIQYASKSKKVLAKNIDIEDRNQQDRIWDHKIGLINNLLMIGLHRSNDEKYQAISRALSLCVVSDICLLIGIKEDDISFQILSGYDLVREAILEPNTLKAEDLPEIKRAWQNQQPLEVSQDHSQCKDITTLKMLFQYQNIGNLLAYPLGLPNKQLAGGVIFVSPYTGKTFGDKTIHLMDQVSHTLGQALFSADKSEQTEQELLKVQDHSRKLIKELQQIRFELGRKESNLKKLTAKNEVDKIQATTSINQLKSQIIELSMKINTQQHQVDQMEQMQLEIRQLSNEREQLRIALNRANATIKDLQTQTGQTGPIRLSLDNQMISLDSIAANIRLQVAPQLQEKNCDFEIHNPDGRMMIKTDPELLQTALKELITNAVKSSSLAGTIRLDQKLSLEMGVLIVQVTDFGDGLSEVEQAALFSGQHNTIPGIGDVSAIRKAIRAIRVLNGKIWLKSKKASYTTFRFQIPVRIID